MEWYTGNEDMELLYGTGIKKLGIKENCYVL
jgi:hypothetical protein